jgi:molecular chaperone DnaK (HSP70)
MTNHFLGFDLGHADTAIALVGGGRQERFAAPATVEIQGQTIQPTALLRTRRDGKPKIVIGTRAIREASKSESSQSGNLRAAFKTRPSSLGEAEDDIGDFFAACLGEAAFTPLPPEGWAATAITVGCPSGWSADQDIVQYRDILVEGISGTPMAAAEVTVVPESRAALLQAIDNPNSPLTTEARGENILVIDIGSSTLDFSLIAPEQKAAPLLDAGLDLGASFFDRQVLEACLRDHPEAEKFLEFNPHYRDLWVYFARRTKEQYFLEDPADRDEIISGAPIQTYVFGGERRRLEISVTAALFDEFRASAFDRPLHPSKELALDPLLLEGKSWEELYRISLRALKEAIGRRGSSYGRVLLAGGASRMPFTEEIAREVFGAGENSAPVLRDPEPSHMVSRGLARWGRKRESVERFAAEAKRLLRQMLPGLIEERFPELRSRLSSGLAATIFEEIVTPVLERWRDGAFKTGHDVRAEIEIRYQDWIRSEEGSSFFVRTINGWWRDEVKYALDQELDRLHAAYDISRDIQLQFENAIEPDIFTFSARNIDLPFETIIQITLIALAYAVTLAVDVSLGGIPFFTGALTAAVAVGGRPIRQWISGLDVPAFARRLPDKLPGRERLFEGQVRSRVEKELDGSFDKAKASITQQIEAAIQASIVRQTERARVLLMGSEAEAKGRAA